LSAWSRGEPLPELVLPDDFDGEPVREPVTSGNFTWGKLQLVGHGERTNLNCGRFSMTYGCLGANKSHDKTSLDGKNYKGKVYTRKVFHSCDKPSCPKCVVFGWAGRLCKKIEKRLAEASKRFGLVEHIVASLPVKHYGLDYEASRKVMRKALEVRGVIGGVHIFHGFRYNKQKGWYFSPHYHVLGFIRGGYECRRCKKKCFKSCSGFVNRSYRANEKDNFIVKVMGKRKTVAGTASYQLKHSSIDITKKRFHVAIWFGVCSYHKLKLTKEKFKSICPVCGKKLVRLRYSGDRRAIWSCYGSDRASVRKVDSFEDLEEDGVVVWHEREEERVYRNYGDR